MTLFTFHFAKAKASTTAKAMMFPPSRKTVAGLRHAECMTQMTLGAPIVSPARMQLQNLTMFASWDDPAALDNFLENSKLGQAFADGWHVRMKFIRRWGHISEFDGLPESVGDQDPSMPVVAVTLARMKLPQIPRFISWGKPVETLVRDHPGKTFATAAMRLPRTVSTFSIWRSLQDMVDMVRGHGVIAQPKRHADAMIERTRKNFHFEFTTLRFKPISEYGEWEGRKKMIPDVQDNNDLRQLIL